MAESPQLSPRNHDVDDTTVYLQVQQFVDDFHYRILESGLGRSWNRKKVAWAALKVCKLNGLIDAYLEDEDLHKMAELDEPDMVRALVQRLTPDSKRNFKHQALQFQHVVMSVSRILYALEENRQEDLLRSMEDSDSAGVSQQILKQAVVSASRDATRIRMTHKSWAANTEARLSRLSKAADQAVRVQQQLVAAQSQLDSFGASQNSKTKSVLMGVAAGQDKALINTVFSTWGGYIMKLKAEKDIRQKFEDQIADAERKLFEYKERQLNNVRGVLERNAAAGKGGLIAQTWAVWVSDMQDAKHERELAGHMQQAQAKLSAATAAQKENTKQFMSRMAANGDSSLLSLVWQSWLTWLADYRKDKELEDQVKLAEKQVQEYLAAKNEGAKGVLDRMSAGSNSGLLAMIMQYWIQSHNEDKKAREMEEKMNAANDRFSSLNGRQKDSAKSVQQRINEQMNTNMVMRVLSEWLIETKQNRVTAYYSQKVESKQRQLQSVQSMFKSFAAQLDHGLGPDSDSARKSQKVAPPKSDRETKGGVHLPDIHSPKPIVV